jgi:hypothetical protein
MTSTTKRRSFLIQEPYDDDAIRFIEAMFRAFGLRPVCWYRSPKDRFYGEQQYAILKSSAIEAAYNVDEADLEAFARKVAEEYEIVAAIPYREDTVEHVARMLPHLPDVDWVDGATLGRFRDKQAMKTFIRRYHPTVRVPASRSVRTFDDVFNPNPPDRFVLKPNDGMGSTSLGFFTPDNPDGIRAHLDSRPGLLWIMEEFIDGTEFRVNGQVRRDGTVQPLVVARYLPQQVTETFTLGYATEHGVMPSDPEWDRCIAYTESIVAATGITGSPFHLEFRIDDHGPAMVDFAARTPSEACGVNMSWLHPQRPDFFAVACRDYVGPNEFALDPVDTRVAEKRRFMSISGISKQEGVITAIAGLEQVERLPEFVSWPVRPALGDQVRVTTDLRGTPYILNLRHDGDVDRTMELDAMVRSLIRIQVAEGARDLPSRLRNSVLPRAARKATWLAHRLRNDHRRSTAPASRSSATAGGPPHENSGARRPGPGNGPARRLEGVEGAGAGGDRVVELGVGID